jgi:AcrR family transcriptional regulator
VDGRARRWDGHRIERRRELARAARRAVHHHGPALSMDELAAHIGTSKSIVYRYFTDKAGLQGAVGELVLDAVRDALADAGRGAGSARERLGAMIGAYLGMVESSPHVYAFVTGATGDAAARPAFTTRAAGVVAEPLSGLLAEVDADPAAAGLWAAGVVGFVHSVGEWWLADRPGGRLASREALAAQVTAWLWVGAAGEPVPGGAAAVAKARAEREGGRA